MSLRYLFYGTGRQGQGQGQGHYAKVIIKTSFLGSIFKQKGLKNNIRAQISAFGYFLSRVLTW